MELSVLKRLKTIHSVLARMKDLTGEIRANPKTGNAWKVVESGQKLRVKCVQGPDEGKTEKINRVKFVDGLLNPDEIR